MASIIIFKYKKFVGECGFTIVCFGPNRLMAGSCKFMFIGMKIA